MIENILDDFKTEKQLKNFVKNNNFSIVGRYSRGENRKLLDYNSSVGTIIKTDEGESMIQDKYAPGPFQLVGKQLNIEPEQQFSCMGNGLNYRIWADGREYVSFDGMIISDYNPSTDKVKIDESNYALQDSIKKIVEFTNPNTNLY